MLTARELVVLPGKDAAVVEERIKALLDDLVDERAFPGSRGAGHANKLFQRDLDVDVFKVVVTGTADDDRFATGPPALAGDLDGLLAAEVLAGQRLSVVQDLV